MLDTAKTLIEMLSLYGALWFANTLLGIHNSLNSGYKFSWKYLGAGTIKAIVGAVALLVGSGALYALPQIFTDAGISVTPAVASAMSILGVIGVVGAGAIAYAGKFFTNVQELFSSDTAVKLEVRDELVTPDEPEETIIKPDTTE